MAKGLSGGIQTKTATKAAAKPAKKPAKTGTRASASHKMMSVAAVSALAASAEASIIKSKKIPASEKAKRLEIVADFLETAKQRRLSKSGEWLLAHIHEPTEQYDKRAVMK